jgi:hypothetical protein
MPLLLNHHQKKKDMKQTCLLIGALLIIVAPSFAQTDTMSQSIPVFKKSVYLRSTAFLYSVNLNSIWLSNMQHVLKTKDFASESRFTGSIPFEAGVRFQDWAFSTNVTLPVSLGDAFHPKMVTISLFAERAVFKSRNFRLNVGAGASLYEYSFILVQDEPNRQVGFQDLFTTSFLSTPVISNKGGAFDVTVSLSNREKKPVSVGNCFRIGYRRGFTDYQWKSQSFDLLGAPKDQLDMVYFQYLISLSKNY